MQETNIPLSSPRGRLGGALLRFPLLILDVPFFTFSVKVGREEKQRMMSLLQPGDMILTTDKLFPVWQTIMRVFWNSEYTHAAIYEGNESFIEATTFHPSGDGVARTAAEDFLSGYKKFRILRPPYHSGKDRNDAVAFAVSQLGSPYDYALDAGNNGTMYCSKLAALSLLSSGIRISPRRFRGFLWKRFYIPDDFIQIKGMATVYTSKGQRKSRTPDFLLIFCVALLFMIGQVPFFYILSLVLFSALAGWLQLLSVKSALSDNKASSYRKLNVLKNEQVS